jgi:hypothetical protein
MKNFVSFFICFLFVCSFYASSAQLKTKKINDTVIDPIALTIDGNFGQAINGKSFQQDALATFNGFQYVGFYNAARHVCLARRKLPAGKWEILEMKDYAFKSNDAHNVISIGICPEDGTIHMAFDHHVHPLHYRISKKGVATDPENIKWDSSLFGPVTSALEKGKSIKVTYPRFWQTPDGGLQFCYRSGGSGNGDRMVVDYDPKTGEWKNTRQIDSGDGLFTDAMGSSSSRCSYPNGYDYGPNGKLHATWVWREDAQGSNHDLLYAWSNDGGFTWRNNSGDIFQEPPGVDASGLKVVNIGREYGLMNTHGQAVDSEGRIHVIMWHCSDETLKVAGSKPGEFRWGPPEARRYFHYWRDKNGDWQHRELPWVAGDRPKLFIDRNNNIFLIHSAEMPIENNNFSADQGDLVIAYATGISKWTDWKIVHVEKGPFVNEMLGDVYRWKEDGILSVMVQEMPIEKLKPTPLRILDFSFLPAQ